MAHINVHSEETAETKVDVHQELRKDKTYVVLEFSSPDGTVISFYAKGSGVIEKLLNEATGCLSDYRDKYF